MLSNEPMDNLTKDVEVAAVKAIMLARAAWLCHGHIETELREKVVGLEKAASDLKRENRDLSKLVESLQATIEKNKSVIEEAELCLSCNIALQSKLRKEENLEKVEKARKEAVELAEAKGK